MTEPDREAASPVCYANEADDAYMGFASKAELAGLLNELLEAERAGSRVTLESAAAAKDAAIADLLRTIQKDEARWCAMLSRHLKAMNAPLSGKTGAFHGKAMGIADLRERIVFLNRGQGWVVKKLREMLPRVRGDALHADLRDMLASHEANIALANEKMLSTQGSHS